MRSLFGIVYLTFFLIVIGWGDLHGQAFAPSDRPFYEYKGNYGQQIKNKKSKFKEAFGYGLVNMGRNWSLDEIKLLHKAFNQLPPTFHRISKLKSLYRLENIVFNSEQDRGDDVPAATLPSFSTIYENISQSYKLFVQQQELRVEFYNPLFYEDQVDVINIIHHEMAHAFDFSNGFLSFSDEWISLTKFRVLHILALDGGKESDSLYTLVNDPQVDNYAPVSTRNLSTYSRQNPQEDFANSVTAYIHYPYFRYTHPSRYKFLKKNVFDGKEYFPEDLGINGFEEKINSDLENALGHGSWEDVRNIFIELSRGYFPDLEKTIIGRIQKVLGSMSVSMDKDKILGLATCYLMQPEGLKLRKHLIRSGRISVKTFLKNPRCFRDSRDAFEKNISRWSPSNVYFYHDRGSSYIQFVDPALATAYVRGFETHYFWKIFIEDGSKKPLAEGRFKRDEGGNGSIQINLMESADSKFEFPAGKTLRMELQARRVNPQNFKKFESEKSVIRFVFQPWFRYLGPDQPGIRMVTPFNSQEKFH